jgi:probable HAF family extracellular repeat protein
VVVGISQTAQGIDEAFLWTRGGGMRSLGTLGGPFGFAISVNTHRRVVGRSLTADGRMLPFLWTPSTGMHSLPTLGGDFGVAVNLTEFGTIIGRSARANGAVRATLWTPAAGPLTVAHVDDSAEPELAAPSHSPVDQVRRSCGFARELSDGRRYGSDASRVCLAR